MLFILVCRESKKQFITYGSELNHMMKYLDRNDVLENSKEKKDAITAICDELRKKKKHVDTVDLMVQINGILGEYALIERSPQSQNMVKRFDISKIDYDLLRREFAKVRKKNFMLIELDELILRRLDEMLRANPERRVAIYLLEKIKRKIAEFNHWTDKQETKAKVDTLIGEILCES